MRITESNEQAAQDTEVPQPADRLASMYLRYRGDLVEFVRRKFGPGPPEPEDVAQAVFLQLASSSSTALIQSPRSFLLKAAQNVVLDYHRSKARRRDFVGELQRRVGDNVSDLDPERVVAGEERLRRLVGVLGRLPARKRQMVLLNRIYGMSCEEIGQRMGVSSEAVQKQIERVLRECLTALERDGLPKPERSLRGAE